MSSELVSKNSGLSESKAPDMSESRMNGGELDEYTGSDVGSIASLKQKLDRQKFSVFRRIVRLSEQTFSP